MPISDAGNKQRTIDILKHYKATRILELGVGYGQFGRLITDSIENSKVFGIEIFKPYFEKIPQECYVKLFNEDMRLFNYESFIKEQPIDAIIIIDSLEHLQKNEGFELLKKLEQLVPLIIVSVPIVEYEQGEMYGNEWEEHKAQWTSQDLIELGYSYEFNNKVIGVFYKKCFKTRQQKAAICYLTFDRFNYTKKSLMSILENTKRDDYDLILWDNGSFEEGMIDWLRNVCLNNGFYYLFFKRNEGLTRAMNNQMRIMNRMSKYDVFCHIANDVVVPKYWLDGVFDAIQSKKVGAVGLNLEENKITPVTLVDGVELEKICDDGCISGAHYCIPKWMYDLLGGYKHVSYGYGQQDANYSLQIKALPLDVWDYYLPLSTYKGEHLGVVTGDEYDVVMRQRLNKSGSDARAGRKYRDQLRHYRHQFDQGIITAEKLISLLRDSSPFLFCDKSQLQETNIMKWIE